MNLALYGHTNQPSKVQTPPRRRRPPPPPKGEQESDLRAPPHVLPPRRAQQGSKALESRYKQLGPGHCEILSLLAVDCSVHKQSLEPTAPLQDDDSTQAEPSFPF